jgi:O-antigen/teichoic acid export membrane protein
MTAVPQARRSIGDGQDPRLTRKATFNALAALVDYAARMVIYLVLAPLLLRYLGAAGYGTWQVLQRLIGHTAPANGRPGEALKWVVAHSQSSDDFHRKRVQVGNALAVWLLFLPLVLVSGTVLTLLAPSLVDAPASQTGEVRLAAVLLVVNVVVLGLAAVPQSVLQGENLGYRRLGLSTAVLMVGALLTVAALRLGWGLVGVAAMVAVTTVLNGVTFWSIVKRYVPWWGFARPDVAGVRGFVGLSWWFLLWNLVMHAMKGSDVIVLAAVGGVAMVTTYTLTSYVPHAVGDVAFVLLSATMPGLGGLVGAGQHEQAARVRGEMMAVSWLVAVSSSVGIVVWLPSFLALWVGSTYDAGTTATVLICLLMLQLVLIRVDSNVIDLTLRVRAKVLLGLGSVALSAALALLLLAVTDLGITGLVVGFVLGRIPLSLAYPFLVGRLLRVPGREQWQGLWRPAAVSAGLVGGAVAARSTAPEVGWPLLVLAGPLTVLAAAVLAYFAGLRAGQRHRIGRRLRKVVGRR